MSGERYKLTWASSLSDSLDQFNCFVGYKFLMVL
jgi:hypothetical protein